MTRQKERKIKSTQKPSLRSAAFFLVLFFYFLLVFHRPPITLNEPCENHGNPKNQKHSHTNRTTEYKMKTLAQNGLKRERELTVGESVEEDAHCTLHIAQ